ncbi:MAG: hypothetical protein AB2L21_08315 [Anaerolineaceae bacterium]
MGSSSCDFAVLISANAEWREILPLFPAVTRNYSPYGEFFITYSGSHPVTFLHGGWGKVATAGATQYAIDYWQPKFLLNLGTCGGLEGRVDLNTVILAEETVIYDIIEGMSGYQQAIEHYISKADLSWLKDELPLHFKQTKLYSADRDIRPEDASGILSSLGADAGDWESGAFAWVCTRNQKDWLVLRGVSDLISAKKSEALGNISLWHQRTGPIMKQLVDCLPWLLDQYTESHLA